MGEGVGTTVEMESEKHLDIRVLGPMSVHRDGVEVPLPRSRKVRALLAFLALEPLPMSRSRLCDLLWDVPNDPRGELRWCLTKLRRALDDDDRHRVVTTGQSLISLDLSDCSVDAITIARVLSDGVAKVTTERLEQACALFGGDLLDGMQVDGAELASWLVALRQRYRAMRVAVANELVTRSSPGSEAMFRRLEALLQAAPFDVRAHGLMLDALVGAGRLRDAEEHVNGAIRAFEQEGVDWAPLREALAAARRTATASAKEPARAPVVTSVISAAPPAAEARPPRRGSVAVMPFTEVAPGASQIANGLTDDIITRLAKLRALFVIARGTAYALGERGIDALEAGRILSVDYVVSGRVRRLGARMTVHVELAETRDASIVWTEELEGVPDETFSVLDSIVDRIVAAVAEEIERAECHRAVIKPPSSLDAWEGYHRGLWHMYKFTGPDNQHAEKYFREAIALDPTFARAHAGLSFTHFQNVFLDLTPDRDRQMALALETANQSLGADDRDPAAHWAMGRALWLRGDQGALSELERSVELSPNFALGHYMIAFVHAQSGDPRAAMNAAEHSRQLSPFDPLQFGMLGSRAMAHLRLGERDEAADWAMKASSRPNAHAHILAMAATHLAIANRRDQGRELVARIRAKLPSYTVEDFIRAFRFTSESEALLRKGAKAISFD